MKLELWPRADVPTQKGGTPRNNWNEILRMTDEVEDCLARLYCKSRATVLFPSCRAAIYTILETIGVGRASSVGISSWSSHCIISTVGRLAMPVENGLEGMEAILLNNQWGWQRRIVTKKSFIIGDSCDTLISSSADMFCNGEECEVISFPKILGTAVGGAVFCNNVEFAERIRSNRATRNRRFVTSQYELKKKYLKTGDQRCLEYYGGIEAINGFMPLEALHQIESRLQSVKILCKMREKRFERLRHLSGLTNPRGRYPVVMPIRYSKDLGDALVSHGYSLPIRHFDFSCDSSQQLYEKVLCFPLHQDVTDEVLEDIEHIIRQVTGRVSNG